MTDANATGVGFATALGRSIAAGGKADGDVDDGAPGTGFSVSGTLLTPADDFVKALIKHDSYASAACLGMDQDALLAIAKRGVLVSLQNPRLPLDLTESSSVLQVFEDRGFSTKGSVSKAYGAPVDETNKYYLKAQGVPTERLAAMAIPWFKTIGLDLCAAYDRHMGIHRAVVLKETLSLETQDHTAKIKPFEFAIVSLASRIMESIARETTMDMGARPAAAVAAPSLSAPAAASVSPAAAASVEGPVAPSPSGSSQQRSPNPEVEAVLTDDGAGGGTIAPCISAAPPPLRVTGAEVLKAVVAVTQSGEATAGELLPLHDFRSIAQAGVAPPSVLESMVITPDMVSDIFPASFSTATSDKEATVVTSAFRFSPVQPTLRRPPRSRLKGAKQLSGGIRRAAR